MKKLITGFFLLGIFFLGSSLSAQEFGLRAGANYADISNIEDGSKGIIGLQFGPVVDFGLTHNIDLHIAALYAMKGSQDDDSDSDLKSNYIDIPILMRFDFGGLYAEVGPQFSVLLSAKSEGDDVKELLKSSDIAALLGVGYDLGILRIDLRYGIGMTNIIEDPFEDFSNKNKVFTLGATYMFGGSSSGDE